MKIPAALLLMLFSLAATGCSSDSTPSPEPIPAPPITNTEADPTAVRAPVLISTFSIVAADPATGEVGAAVASKYPAVGRVVPYVKPGVGAFCTQHWHHPAFGDQALSLLEQGEAPEAVLAKLLAGDPQREQRQLAIIDATGRVANHNPSQANGDSRYWAAMSGRFYSCQGNTLAKRDVVTAMAAAYEDTPGSLADKLMSALVAADCAGGDHRGRLAAGIRVAKTGHAGDWLALYVDDSQDAVRDLAKKYAALDHEAKGDWPGGKLPFKDPCTQSTPDDKSK